MNIKTDDEIFSKLGDIMDRVETGAMKVPAAVEINNAIGKIIGLRKVRLEESKMAYLIETRDLKIPSAIALDRETPRLSVARK